MWNVLTERRKSRKETPGKGKKIDGAKMVQRRMIRRKGKRGEKEKFKSKINIDSSI